MTGFLRALRGELYALGRRRQMKMALLVVVAGVILRLLWAHFQVGSALTGSLDETLIARRSNFWPRFAQAAGVGMILTELLTLVTLGAALPREIGRGAARDPLVRRISRPAFLLARAVTAMLFPLILAAAAFASAAAVGLALFPPGNVTAPPVVLDDDPAVRAAYQAWLSETGVSENDLAAWLRYRDDGLDQGLSGEEAAGAASGKLGLPPIHLSEEFESQVPLLIFFETEIRGGILDAMRDCVLPLLILGLFSFCVSVIFPSSALSAGVALGSVLLFGVFLARELGDGAWWFFPDWLPGMGADSQLELARKVADGYGEPLTSPEALRTGVLGSFAEGIGFLILSLIVFRRRRL